MEMAEENIREESRSRLQHDKLCRQLQKAGVDNVRTINADAADTEYAQYVTFVTNISLEHSDFKILVPASAKLRQGASILSESGFNFDITHSNPKEVARFVLAVDAHIDEIRESFDTIYIECQKAAFARRMADVAITNMLRAELAGTGLGFRLDRTDADDLFEVSIIVNRNNVMRRVLAAGEFRDELLWMTAKAKELQALMNEIGESLRIDTQRFGEEYEIPE